MNQEREQRGILKGVWPYQDTMIDLVSTECLRLLRPADLPSFFPRDRQPSFCRLVAGRYNSSGIGMIVKCSEDLENFAWC